MTMTDCCDYSNEAEIQLCEPAGTFGWNCIRSHAMRSSRMSDLDLHRKHAIILRAYQRAKQRAYMRAYRESPAFKAKQAARREYMREYRKRRRNDD